MNSIKTLYKLMEVSSRDLEIPDAYQRKLNTERVAKIVAGFNERIANEPKVAGIRGVHSVSTDIFFPVGKCILGGECERGERQSSCPRGRESDAPSPGCKEGFLPRYDDDFGK